MPVTTVTLGTIDLTTLCGHGCDCGPCCGLTCGACSGIGTTLHGTITSVGAGCSCVLGKTCTLTGDGVTKWVGTIDFHAAGCFDAGVGQGLVTFSVYCSGGVFLMDITAAPTACLAGNIIGITATSTVCSPFQLVFSSTSVLDCCNTNHSPTIVMTVN